MYKVVIGLEVHCELHTNSKNFSTAKNTFTNKPNTNVMPVDIGLPGILPVVNKEAVKKALKVATALNCKLPDEVLFDRKNYYYPDLPKGYQITQVTKPMGVNGFINVKVKDSIKKVEIHQIHLEEDTASLEHFNTFSLLDYNRSGIPLIEIVTEPCLSSADEAISFLETLRSLFLYTEVSEADSKKGQMRCDVNISLMKEGSSELGTKVEMKNINAFNIVRSSIEYEIKRQTEILNSGEKVLQQTRRYSEEDNKTYPMRDKADAIDYKYFIEPNLPPVKLSEEFILEIKNSIPMLQHERVEKYINKYKLSEKDAETLTKEKDVANYFEDVIKNGIDAKTASNWVISVILGSLNKLDISLKEMFITSTMLADILKLVEEEKLSSLNCKKVLYEAMDLKKPPLDLINEQGIKQIDDKDTLIKVINEVIDENLDIFEQYLNGNNTVANFYIGKVMSKTNRQANPKVALELIKEVLEGRKNNV